mmetsp:Transcript_19181/g.72472  ORF Transcript_19181/g.72472 Transcript_19181/m.72472 type:complete len:575 (-) Transcript_19181:1338-3062(-)
MIRAGLVVLERLHEVWVAVAQEPEPSREAIEAAEATVSTTHHSHRVPDVPRAEEVVDDESRRVDGVTRLVDPTRHPHVVHLRWHNQSLTDGWQARHVAEVQGGNAAVRSNIHRRLLRQVSGERLGHRHGRAEHFLISREVDDQGVAVEERFLNLLQAAKKRRPLILGLLEQLPHGVQVRDASRLLAKHAEARVVRSQARGREGVAGRHDGRLHGRLRLAQHLNDPRLAIQVHVGQNVLHDREQLRDLVGDGLAAKEKIVHDLVSLHALALRMLDEVTQDRRAHATRVAANASRESRLVLLVRAALEKHVGEERHQRHVFPRQRAQIQANVGVQDAVAGKLVRHKQGTAVGTVQALANLDRRRLGLALEIVDRERGNRCLRLGGIFGSLRCSELLRLLDNPIEIRVRELRLDGREPVFFFLDDLGLQGCVGYHGHRQAVTVVQEELLQGVHEDLSASLLQIRLQLREGIVEADAVGGIAIVDPLPHGPEHEAQSPGEGAGVELAQAELDRVHARVDRILREALLGNPFESGQDERLDLLGLLRLDALQTNIVGALQQLRAQAAADHGRSQVRLEK